MPDHNFFKSAGSFTLGKIAELCGCELSNGADESVELHDVAPLDKAGAGQLSFFDNVKYKDMFSATKAEACFVSKDAVKFAPEGTALLISDHPYKAYAIAAQAFYPEPHYETSISDDARVCHTAQIGKGAYIDAFAVIGSKAKIGANCRIESGVVIGENVQIGDHVRIGANASVSHAIIGDNVRLYPGVRIGQDGFGFAPDPSGFVKVPQVGRVIIEDHVEIGANTCIDRGSGPDTVIGEGTWIDNLVQIGHNVKIGKGCVLVSQVGISGSTVLEDYVMIGGQGGIAGHLHIGKGAQIAAKSGVMRDVPAGEVYMGAPAMPAKEFMRQVATLKRLINQKKDA